MNRIIRVNINENNISVENILRKQIGLTKKQIRHLKFITNGIQKNGCRCRINEVVHIGDVLQIQIEDEKELSAHLESEESSIDIIYEDQDLLAVNKPMGIVTHPQGVHYQDTLANQIVSYYRKKGEGHSVRPIGRLDKETSGIVIFAKNKIAAARLQEQREKGQFIKTYLAVVEGKLVVDNEWHKIDKPMKQQPDDYLKMIVADDGKRAITNYYVIADGKEYSVVKVSLATGRTHQIRVHMKSIGHPLVGDLLYGTKDKEDSRALLHAWKVELIQPFTGEKIVLDAPIPEDIQNYYRC